MGDLEENLSGKAGLLLRMKAFDKPKSTKEDMLMPKVDSSFLSPNRHGIFACDNYHVCNSSYCRFRNGRNWDKRRQLHPLLVLKHLLLTPVLIAHELPGYGTLWSRTLFRQSINIDPVDKAQNDSRRFPLPLIVSLL
jgi:hypothetical protein